MKSNDEWEPFKRLGQAALIAAVIATVVILLVGCCDKPLTPAPQTVHHDDLYNTIQHTGPVIVIDISVSFCEPYYGGKSGSGVCDRAVTLETPDHRVNVMGLCRTGQWPPVWHGMYADIYFDLKHDDWDDHDCAVIRYAEEQAKR